MIPASGRPQATLPQCVRPAIVIPALSSAPAVYDMLLGRRGVPLRSVLLIVSRQQGLAHSEEQPAFQHAGAESDAAEEDTHMDTTRSAAMPTQVLSRQHASALQFSHPGPIQLWKHSQQVSPKRGHMFLSSPYKVGCGFHTRRVDTLASYGQLVGPPSYDDSTLFDRSSAGRHDTSTCAGAARSSSAPAGPPPLKITVTDPVKKVRRPHQPASVKGIQHSAVSGLLAECQQVEQGMPRRQGSCV